MVKMVFFFRSPFLLPFFYVVILIFIMEKNLIKLRRSYFGFFKHPIRYKHIQEVKKSSDTCYHSQNEITVTFIRDNIISFNAKTIMIFRFSPSDKMFVEKDLIFCDLVWYIELVIYL